VGVDAERRIPGDYQWRAFHHGWRYQRAWHRARFELARQLCDPAPGMRVLDAACGAGVLAHVLGGSGARVCNFDMRVSACRVALQRQSSAGAVAGLLSALPFGAGSFDVACLLEVIEHLPEADAGAVLRDLRRIVVRGGRLLVTTPNYASAWPWLERIVDGSGLAPRMGGSQHVAHYHGTRLTGLLEAAGWRVLESGSFNLLTPVGALVSVRLIDRLLRFERRHLRRGGLLLYAVARST
jgi:2-polyprenyl-3-methyl-5-hydroxy-6-metoxy-1,4-benzoquinol methylase